MKPIRKRCDKCGHVAVFTRRVLRCRQVVTDTSSWPNRSVYCYGHLTTLGRKRRKRPPADDRYPRKLHEAREQVDRYIKALKSDVRQLAFWEKRVGYYARRIEELRDERERQAPPRRAVAVGGKL